MNQTMWRTCWAALWLAGFVSFGVCPVLAQGDPPAAEPPAVEAPTFVPVPQVAARSEELRTSLRQITEALVKGPEVARIEARLDCVPGLWIGGNSLRGIAINSCIEEASTIAEAALAFLDRLPSVAAI